MNTGYEYITVYCPCGAMLPTTPPGAEPREAEVEIVCGVCGETVRARFWRRQVIANRQGLDTTK